MKKTAIIVISIALCGLMLTGCGRSFELEEKGRQVKENFAVFMDSVGGWLATAWDELWPG